VVDHGLAIELRHAWRTHHHCDGARVLSLAAVLDAGSQPVGRGARNHRDSSVHLRDNGLQHGRALTLV
jgi:hypothetical protein